MLVPNRNFIYAVCKIVKIFRYTLYLKYSSLLQKSSSRRVNEEIINKTKTNICSPHIFLQEQFFQESLFKNKKYITSSMVTKRIIYFNLKQSTIVLHGLLKNIQEITYSLKS